MDLPEPQIENRFPHSVEVRLHFRAVSESNIELSLTINFNSEQEIQVPGGKPLGLPGGKVTFGIRRGDLKFTLLNCALPLEQIVLLKPFEICIEIEQQQTQSREVQSSLTLASQSLGTKSSMISGEKSSLKKFQVKCTGGEDSPRWIFESHDDYTTLEGLLKQTQLGIICIKECPCEVKAIFTVRGEDIRITWGKIGLTNNINRNKLAIIERIIALRYLKSIVEDNPVSIGSWRYG